MSKKVNKSTNDSFNTAKYTEQAVTKYVKKLSVVSKKKMVAGIAAATVLVAGGVGAGTYFGIKANNGTGGEVVSEMYIIEFNTNGGSEVSTLKVGKNKEIDLTKHEPSKPGFKFGGWYYDKELSNPCPSKITISKDLKIYAKWALPEQGDIFEYELSGVGYKITKLKSSVDKSNLIVVKIPSIHEDKPVVELNNDLFKNCFKLENVEIDEGVEKIGSFCFSCCYNLKSVSLPKTLLTIDQYAFSTCTKLENINLPDGLLSIGSAAFESCVELQEIKIPNSVIELGSGCFQNCSSAKSIALSTSCAAIPSYSFRECTSLTDVFFPICVKTIGMSAFSDCKFSKVSFEDDFSTWQASGESTEGWEDVPSSKFVEWLCGGNKFRKKEFTEDTGLFNCTYIGKDEKGNPCVSVSLNDSSLEESYTDFVIPSIVKYEGKDLYVTEINEGSQYSGTLDGIKDLAEKLVLPPTLKKINTNLMMDYTGTAKQKLDTIQFLLRGDGSCDLEYIASNAFNNQTFSKIYSGKDGEAWKKNNLPEGLKYIGGNAFNGVKKIESIEIPSTVEYIGVGKSNDGYENIAFNGCASLKTINVDSANKYYKSIDGVLYEKLKSSNINDDEEYRLIYVPQGFVATNKTFVIPEGVKIIGTNAFYCLFQEDDDTGTKTYTVDTVVVSSTVTDFDEGAVFSCAITNLTIKSQTVANYTEEYILNHDLGFYNGINDIKLEEGITVPDGSYIKKYFDCSSASCFRTFFECGGDLGNNYFSSKFDLHPNTPYAFKINVDDKEEWGEEYKFGTFYLKQENSNEIIPLSKDNVSVTCDGGSPMSSDELDFTDGKVSFVNKTHDKHTYIFTVTLNNGETLAGVTAVGEAFYIE